MSSTLLSCEQELSRQIGDYWYSATTGAGSATTLVDTALRAKQNDWVTKETWAFLIEEPTGAANIYDERLVSSLDSTNYTLTTLSFDAAPGTGIDYEVHRLFSPSEKRRALVAAARQSFPHLFQEVWNEEMVSGNWLSDGSFERWTTSTNPTVWTDTTVTATQTTGAGYFRHGATSCKLSGSTGTLVQEWKAGTAEFEDLKELRGRAARFSLQAWCNTASSLRISINDGTTETYSGYHSGNSAWTETGAPLEVSQAISPTATKVSFTIYFTTGATAYVDDARVIGGNRSRLYIGHLGLAQNRPHQVWMETTSYSQNEGWMRLRDYKIDQNGYLYLPTIYPNDYRLRIRGIGYLDFLASGVSSTAWTATININQPQLDILIVRAALYLYQEMSMPNFSQGTREKYQEMMGYWKQELAERQNKFGMIPPAATAQWGVG